MKLHFAPTAAGAQQATLGVGDGTASASVALTGTGAMSAPPGTLTVTPVTQDFGTLTTGSTSASVSFTFANGGGSATPPLMVSLTGADSADFRLTDPCSGHPLAVGGSCKVSVVFEPSATGSKTASLAGAAQGLGTASASLSGTAAAPAAFTVTPSTFDFGSILEGATTGTQTFTAQNVGGIASGVPAVAMGGTNAGDFAVSGSTCTSALAASAKCTFDVAFEPSTTSAESATVTVSGAGTTGGSASLAGTGLAPAAISLSPSSQPFGSWQQGADSPDTTFTLTNTGGVQTGVLTLSLGGSDASQFVIDNDTCSGAQLAATSGTCTLGVHFAPTAGTLGAVQATLQASATPGGTTAASLTGTALAPAALAISPPVGFPGFGTQQAGTAGTTATYTITNTGGVSTGTVGVGLGSLSPPGDFTIVSNGCSGQLGPGGSCPVTVQFTPPANTFGSETATLTANASPGGAPSIGLGGTSFTPAVISMQPPSGFTGFGNVPIGNSSTFQFTLTNSGSQAADAPTISTSNALFTVSGSTCGAGITTSCTFDVTFTPTSPPSTQNVTLTATSSPGGTASYGPTSGTGTGAVLQLSPSSWNAQFNTCTNQTQDFTITNTGNIPTTTAISIALAGAAIGPFQTGSYTCLSDLQPNTPCTIPLTFQCPGFDSNSGIAGNGTMTVSAGGAVAQSATLDVGAGVAIAPNPGMSGEYVSYGNSYTQTFTITNYMTTATHAFGAAFQFTGTGSTFYSATDIDCSNVALQPYGSGANTCQFKVTFAPTGGNGTREDTTLMQVGYYIVGTTVVFATISEAPLEAYEQL